MCCKSDRKRKKSAER